MRARYTLVTIGITQLIPTYPKNLTPFHRGFILILSHTKKKSVRSAQKMKVQIQGGLVKVYAGTGRQVNTKFKRGKVTKFSRKSRKRLLEMVARIRKQTKAIFITLTYGQKFPDIPTSKKHLKEFMRRMKRLFPESAGIWRLELQKRGAPHFHLICFNIPYWKKEELAAVWHSIVGDKYADNSSDTPKPPFTRIELIRSHKKAMSYVSKYVAKMPDSEQKSGGFNYVPYQNTENFTGRVWGVFNRAFMPFAELIECVFQGVRTLEDLRFYASFQSKFIKPFGSYGLGFTLFTGDLQKWRKIVLECLFDEVTGRKSWTQQWLVC